MKLCVLCLLFFLIPIASSAAQNAIAGKKLIEYGWDVPDTKFVREHVTEMEKVPFDGVVIKVMYPGGTGNEGCLGWNTFCKKLIKPEDYQHAIDDLKATDFKRLTDNFIQVIAFPAGVDWFDPDWSIAAENAASLARVAKLTGCRGIMFDPEMYNENPTWSYDKYSAELRSAHTFDEYAAKVKDCGRQFVRAINREYPDLTILTLYGHCLPYYQSTAAGSLQKADYGLLAAFYDGMCEAASPQTTLVDGHESSYGYKKRQQFVDARTIVLEKTKAISTSPKSFTKHVRAGFGIWTDFDWRNHGWDEKDFSKNYWSPEELRSALNYALEQSDGYVWVYTEKLRWWDFNAPKAYVDALALCKTGPAPVVKESK